MHYKLNERKDLGMSQLVLERYNRRGGACFLLVLFGLGWLAYPIFWGTGISLPFKLIFFGASALSMSIGFLYYTYNQSPLRLSFDNDHKALFVEEDYPRKQSIAVGFECFEDFCITKRSTTETPDFYEINLTRKGGGFWTLFRGKKQRAEEYCDTLKESMEFNKDYRKNPDHINVANLKSETDREKTKVTLKLQSNKYTGFFTMCMFLSLAVFTFGLLGLSKTDSASDFVKALVSGSIVFVGVFFFFWFAFTTQTEQYFEVTDTHLRWYRKGKKHTEIPLADVYAVKTQVVLSARPRLLILTEPEREIYSQFSQEQLEYIENQVCQSPFAAKYPLNLKHATICEVLQTQTLLNEAILKAKVASIQHSS